MLKTVFQRMWNSRWKVAAIWIGMILTVSISYCIPVYTDAIQQRILTKNIEAFQAEYGRNANTISLDYQPGGTPKDANSIHARVMRSFSRLDAYFPADPVTGGTVYKIEYYKNYLKNKNNYENTILYAVDRLEEHVELVSGRMYNPARDDGVLEVIGWQNAMARSLWAVGEVYTLDSLYTGDKPIRIELVGIITPKDTADPFWYKPISEYTNGMFISMETARQRIDADTAAFSQHISQFIYYTVFDTQDIRTHNASVFVDGFDQFKRDMQQYFLVASPTFPLHSTLSDYVLLGEQFSVSMYTLIIPLFILLAFYIIMVSQLKLENEQNEISVMQSRGASRRYILSLYFWESVLMMGSSLCIAPFLGTFFCRLIGASNGFMNFISRKALELNAIPSAYLVMLAVALLFILITLLPAFFKAGVNVVEGKRRRTRRALPFYHKYFLDILFFGLGLYSYYSLNKQQAYFYDNMILDAAVQGSGNTEFLLFIANIVFVLGAGMLFLRLYPLLLRLLFKAGRRIYPAWLYAAFNRISRSYDSSYIMLFLIATMSLGIFNADSARSINNHISANTHIAVGADIVYTPESVVYDYEGNEVTGGVRDPRQNNVLIYDDEGELIQTIPVVVPELVADALYAHSEIEHAARVFRESWTASDNVVRARTTVYKNAVEYMFIDPYDFGMTAYAHAAMNGYYLNEYLNAMTKSPNGVLISGNIAEALALKTGDTLTLRTSAGSMTGTILAVVDAFPGIPKVSETKDGKQYITSFVIGNFSYLFDTNPMRPHDFWIKKADGVSDRAVYDLLAAHEYGLAAIDTLDQAIIEKMNTPALQGVNGLLTVSFLISLVICILGFLIYWIISIKSRTLQFGISRALGMTRLQMVLLLVTEQLLISGVALGAGIFIGKIGSGLFAKMLTFNYAAVTDIVPFIVTALPRDLAQITVLMGAMLLFCILLLFSMVNRQQIDRAIKLGEE